MTCMTGMTGGSSQRGSLSASTSSVSTVRDGVVDGAQGLLILRVQQALVVSIKKSYMRELAEVPDDKKGISTLTDPLSVVDDAVLDVLLKLTNGNLVRTVKSDKEIGKSNNGELVTVHTMTQDRSRDDVRLVAVVSRNVTKGGRSDTAEISATMVFDVAKVDHQSIRWNIIINSMMHTAGQPSIQVFHDKRKRVRSVARILPGETRHHSPSTLTQGSMGVRKVSARLARGHRQQLHGRLDVLERLAVDELSLIVVTKELGHLTERVQSTLLSYFGNLLTVHTGHGDHSGCSPQGRRDVSHG